MTRVCTISVVLLLLSGSAAVSGTQAKQPSLRVAKTSPLTLAGRYFHARERVVVKLYVSGDTYVRRTRTTAAGSFSATFDTVTFDRCAGGFAAVAVGATGARASMNVSEKTLQQPDCRPNP